MLQCCIGLGRMQFCRASNELEPEVSIFERARALSEPNVSLEPYPSLM